MSKTIKELCRIVFGTKEGEELLDRLYIAEVLSSKDYSSYGCLAKKSGRSDLVLSLVLSAESAVEERVSKMKPLETDYVSDTNSFFTGIR